MQIIDRNKPIHDCMTLDFYRLEIRTLAILLVLFLLTHGGTGNIVMELIP